MDSANTSDETRVLGICSHPRSGTHLLIDTLRRQCPEFSCWKWPWEPLDTVYLSLTAPEPLRAGNNAESAKMNRILSRSEIALCKTHKMLSDCVRFLQSDDKQGSSKVLYILRDGRDVMASYHVFRQRHVEWARVSFRDFIRTKRRGKTPAEIWAEHVLDAICSERCVRIRYEDLVYRASLTLLRLEKELGLGVHWSKPLLPKRQKLNAFSLGLRRFSIHPRNTAVHGRYGKLRPVKWDNELNREDRKVFHEMAGEALIKGGYVTDESWIDE